MRAIDTNVLLRLIVRDDLKQEARARSMIEHEPVFVPLTVAMECEWVLRSFYKKSRKEIGSVLDRMTDVENIVFEHVDGLRWALGRLVAGADFADMVHIVQAKAGGATELATFDEDIEMQAGATTPLPVETPG